MRNDSPNITQSELDMQTELAAIERAKLLNTGNSRRIDVWLLTRLIKLWIKSTERDYQTSERAKLVELSNKMI